MTPLVSIVLPVYNGEKYLALSIESILSQTFKDFELILVNDCSTDSSESIIRQYAAKDSRIVYLKNDVNLKLPASLNRGFSVAKGKYFTWTSDDNLYYPNAIEKMLEFLQSQPNVAMVYCDCNMIDDTGVVFGFLRAGNPKKLLLGNNIGACFLYKAEITAEIGGYRTDYFLVEDYEYWLRINLHYQIAPFNETLYDYRKHPGNLTVTRAKEIAEVLGKVQWDYFRQYDKKRILHDDPAHAFERLLDRETSRRKRFRKMLQFSFRHPRYLRALISKIVHNAI